MLYDNKSKDLEKENTKKNDSILLLEKDDERVEKTKETLNQDLKNLLAKFHNSIGKNGGIIFFIGEYLIKDKEEELRRKGRAEILPVESLKGYTFDEIQVWETNARLKKGYIRINDEIDIPLADLETSIRPRYFYDRIEATKEWKRLNQIEYELAEEIERNATRAKEYIKKILANNYH